MNLIEIVHASKKRHPRIADAICLLLLACVLAACGRTNRAPAGRDDGASGGDCGPSQTAPLLPGRLLITGNASLELWDHGRRTTIACIRNAPQYFSHPVFAPDGKSIAYVLSTAPTSQAQDWGDDIYTAGPSGANARIVYRHDAPGAQVDSLAWTPDGSSLIYGSFRVLYDSAGRTASAVYAVNRLDLSNGAVAPLLRDASQASISPDGRQLIYVSYPSGDFNVSALAVAGLDGSSSHPILNGQNGFQSFFAPHLSPDGSQVVFAAVGGPLPAARAPRPSPPAQHEPLIVSSPKRLIPSRLTPLILSLSKDALLRIQSSSALQPATLAQADGSPYEVWVASLDGSNVHPVANLREDLPYPLWSADGKQILFLGAAALYLANADGSGVKQIDKGVAHGQIDWYLR